MYNVSPSYLSRNLNHTEDNLNYSNPRNYRYISRYSNTRIINTEEGQHHETTIGCYIPESSSDSYYTVDVTTQDRLDIVSTLYYGNPVNWWIIAKANNLINPFSVEVGTVLRIPPIKSIYNSNGGL